ncbi:Endonuclease, Uma2 family (restriction endonuclease fold) [Streptomyces sp. yr375]|uniref:Uma2 family endonuclease n=1 Tax=Streptomyces sp. yr375 TaxID=1761906 RepID=UPI0008AD551A|nr:Uma2 family endonuclease [Streptomyces sp. yr375]SER38013.1 Endonuclease, Uma2 family (restriction endonuclease fold) [Streptomyces sp. yr375]
MSTHFGDHARTGDERNQHNQRDERNSWDEWDEAVWVWRHTVVPKGCRAEIIDGLVSVTPVSAGTGHAIAERVTRCLYEVIPDTWGVYQWLATAVPSRLGLYVPDLVVLPRAPGTGANADDHVPAAAARLVVEITSKATAHNDRVTKPAGYAQAGVPLYLLIDGLAPEAPRITLYESPEGPAYRDSTTHAFGDPVHLPAPFTVTLDTTGFPMS